MACVLPSCLTEKKKLIRPHELKITFGVFPCTTIEFESHTVNSEPIPQWNYSYVLYNKRSVEQLLYCCVCVCISTKNLDVTRTNYK